MRRIWFRSPLLVVALALAGSGAAEASAVCARLKAQLANASTNASSSAGFQRYDAAAAKQKQQMAQVASDLGSYGCASGSFLVRGGQNAKACATLAAAETKMLANLAALERKRDSYAKQSGMAATRRIEAAIKANGCEDERATIQAAALKGRNQADQAESPRSPGLISVLGDSGGKIKVTRKIEVTSKISAVGNSGASGSRITVGPAIASGGDYRTLCVRSCDGFFFPVSSAASPSDFARDERTCRMMCPGAETSLYFHAAQGEESQDMISARTRQSYSETPNAFAYRNGEAPMTKACGCNMAAFYKEMARREAVLNGAASQTDPVTTWVRPLNRPDPGEDPETVLDAEMALTSEDIAAVLAASTSERPLTQDRRQVRIVGPTFLPDESGALDLKSGGLSLIR